MPLPERLSSEFIEIASTWLGRRERAELAREQRDVPDAWIWQFGADTERLENVIREIFAETGIAGLWFRGHLFILKIGSGSPEGLMVVPDAKIQRVDS